MLIPTKTQTRLEWLEERRKGLGGSDIAALLGISKYKTPVDVYFSKVLPQVDEEASEAATWGTLNEPTIRKEYGRRNGLRVCEYPFSRVGKNEWERGNIDGLTGLGDLFLPSGEIITSEGLEIKTADKYVKGDWGDPGTDEVPDYYLTQIMWYFGIFEELETFHVPVLFGGNRLEVYFVDRDQELIKSIQALATEFWKKHVLEKIPPPPSNSGDCLKIWGADTSTMFPASDRIVELCEIKREKDEKAKIAKAEKDAADEAIKLELGQAEGALSAGRPLVTWKAQETTRLDSKRLKKEKPEIWKQYTNTTTSRVLRLKNK